jgi:thiamine transport system permease protein
MDRPRLRLSTSLHRSRTPLVAVLAAVVPAAVLTVFVVVPLIGMLDLGLRPDGRLDVGHVAATLTRPRVVGVLWFTAWSATAATLLTVLLGVPTAYALYCLRLPGRGLLRVVVTAPFVLPTVVVGVAFRGLLAPSGPLGFLGLDGTAVAIVLALVFFNVSIVVRSVGPWWARLDPRREQAAAALGASPLQVLRTVTLPALVPVVVSSATVVFLFCATAFGVVLTLGGARYSTIETEIYFLTTRLLDLPAAAALSLLQLLVVATLLLLAALSGRGDRRTDRAVRRERRVRASDLPVLLVTGASLLLVVVPVVGLVTSSLRRGGGWSTANYRRLLEPATSGVHKIAVTDAVENSLRIAVDATLLAMLLGLAVAVLTTRRVRGRWRRAQKAFDGLFMLPLGVSAVTIGFGLLVTLDSPPFDFRGSPWLVPLAQALVALPLVVRIVAPALGSIDQRQREAATSLGAGAMRVLWSVDLPLVWRSVAAAAGFAFAVSLGEFGATSFLSRPETPTLPVLVYQLVSRPGADNAGMALAASVVLGLLTTLVIWAVERFRSPRLGAW